jgi:hypothetical protein
MQLCPQLINLPLTAPLEAFSISASSHTMKGSLPPNSRTVFFSYEVDLCATLAPTGTLPVKARCDIQSSIPPVIHRWGECEPDCALYSSVCNDSLLS